MTYNFSQRYFIRKTHRTTYMRGLISPRINIIDNSGFILYSDKEDVLKLIIKQLKIKQNPISYPNRHSKSLQVRGAKTFIKSLRKLGIDRKQTTVFDKSVSDELMPHYLRGIIDSQISFRDVKGNLSMAYNLDFLLDFNEKLNQVVDLQKEVNKKYGKLDFNRMDMYHIYLALYHELPKGALCLFNNRKKFEHFYQNPNPPKKKSKLEGKLKQAKRHLLKGLYAAQVARKIDMTPQNLNSMFKDLEKTTPTVWQIDNRRN